MSRSKLAFSITLCTLLLFTISAIGVVAAAPESPAEGIDSPPAEVESEDERINITIDDSSNGEDYETIKINVGYPDDPTEAYANNEGEIGDSKVFSAVRDWQSNAGYFVQTDTPNKDIFKIVRKWQNDSA